MRKIIEFMREFFSFNNLMLLFDFLVGLIVFIIILIGIYRLLMNLFTPNFVI